MSKESSPCLTRDVSLQASETLCSNTLAVPSATFMPSLAVENTAKVEALTPDSSAKSKQVNNNCEENTEEQKDSTEHQLTVDCERGIRDEHDQGTCRYEYMDIRQSDSTEGEDPAWERRESQAFAAEPEEMGEKVLNEEHNDDGEEEKYHSTNKQPTHQGILSNLVLPKPDVLTAGVEEVEDYEEMTRFGVVSSGWEQADYQNLPVMGRAVSEETGSSRCSGIRGYIKVCAGIGEPGSNTSFDNPDYWHSRLFLKPDAVRT